MSEWTHGHDDDIRLPLLKNMRKVDSKVKKTPFSLISHHHYAKCYYQKLSPGEYLY
jgi:metal-dependent hydrolase (beta-lactamase superfamily II)